MKIKVDFSAGDLSVIKLKGVRDADEQSVEKLGQRASSKKHKQSTGCGGRNQLARLLLKTNSGTASKEETWMAGNSVFWITNSEFQVASIVDQLFPDKIGTHDFAQQKGTVGGVAGGFIGLGIPELEAKRFSPSILRIQRKSKLRKKSIKTPGQRTFARRPDPVLPNMTTMLTLWWMINNR